MLPHGPVTPKIHRLCLLAEAEKWHLDSAIQLSAALRHFFYYPWFEFMDFPSRVRSMVCPIHRSSAIWPFDTNCNKLQIHNYLKLQFNFLDMLWQNLLRSTNFWIWVSSTIWSMIWHKSWQISDCDLSKTHFMIRNLLQTSIVLIMSLWVAQKSC